MVLFFTVAYGQPNHVTKISAILVDSHAVGLLGIFRV